MIFHIKKKAYFNVFILILVSASLNILRIHGSSIEAPAVVKANVSDATSSQ